MFFNSWSWIWTRTLISNEKAIQWAKRQLNGVNENVKKCFKIFKIKSFWKKKQSFLTCALFFMDFPLVGCNFHRDNANRTWTVCLLMAGVHYFCLLFRDYFYKGFVLILSSLLTFVRYLEVSAIRDAHLLEISLPRKNVT